MPVVTEEGELLPELPVAPPRDRMAKSILPDIELIITSLIVPSESPDEDFMSALVNWLARISCWDVRPVALRSWLRFQLESFFAEGSVGVL